MSDINEREDFPEVEVVCPSCQGTSKDRNELYPCAYCDGTGYVTTEFGRKVMAMVLRNLGRKLRDAIEG